MGLTVDQLSRLYRVPSEHVIDYGAHRGDWLLVAAGTGLMLSVMDQQQRFRWCIDIDTLPKDERMRFDEWLVGMQHLTSFIAVVGGWQVTHPELLVRGLQRLLGTVLVYATVCNPPNAFDDFEVCSTLAEFLERLNEIAACDEEEPAVEELFI